MLNAFNTPLILETRRALQMVNDDPSIRALVLTGEGRGFSSGADLAGGGHEGDPTNLTVGEGAAHGMEHRWNPMMDDFHTLSVPTVTAINGVAAGGGVGLALLADVCIAAVNTTLPVEGLCSRWAAFSRRRHCVPGVSQVRADLRPQARDRP